MQLSDALPADLSVGSTSIGVVVGPSPAGPWHDPIGKPLLANGSDYTPATQIRDPGVLQDGADYYIVFGTFESVKLTSLFLAISRPFLLVLSPLFRRSLRLAPKIQETGTKTRKNGPKRSKNGG